VLEYRIIIMACVNGLRIRPQLNKQVVMNAGQAAELTATLRPQITVPHHYASPAGGSATA
jgi:L-ascorbate metabolism protein UlaG (beta-lactamase superfamily)